MTTKGKPGRKPTAAAIEVASNANHAVLAGDARAADQFAALQAGYGEERDLLNQVLGQAQMADSFAKFSKTVLTSKMAFVKEHKLYQQLKGQKTQDGLEFSGTWSEFCNVLGWTPEHANEAIANLNQFGSEALESMSRMGIGYREMRQYRKLPEDQKLALIEVAKTGDKEGFVDLAEEIIARHAKEKEALTAQVQEAKDSLEAKDRVLESKAEMITRLEEQTSRKFKPRPGSEARSAHEQALLTEVDQVTSSVYLGMHRLFKAVDATLSDSGGGMGEAILTRARQAIEFLAQQMVDMTEEFGISVDLENRLSPTGLDEEALNVLEARNAAAESARSSGRVN
ncbi:hypothetical protein [Diaphorobacter sp. HDW4A]|uniref:hypothetical protein n=1 Tax=Diaphorobacter sp. HDW4A TaxID=2714924 RepID=UPI001981866D|nr:hypothetical protein [Diaphorobacter sp. HDW4A]